MLPLLVASTLTVLSAALAIVFLLRPEASLVPPERLQQLTRAQLDLTDGTSSVVDRLTRFVSNVRRRRTRKDNRALQLRLVRAGIRSEHSADVYVAVRFVATVIAFALAALLPGPFAIWAIALPLLAFFSPALYLSRRISARKKAISRGMSDMLDLLVICVEAGLGLDQAVLRVAEELATTHPAIHEELLLINREQRAGRPRGEAWADAVERMNVPEMTAFTSMTMQAERFGTPIARALGDYAANVRLTRIQVAEEKAAKTTIKIIFPLAFFIFPSIFIVLLGPAVLTIMRNF